MSKEIEIMKAIVHNKILLMVILSKLGMEDEEIDTLNQTIYKALDNSIEEFLKEKDNEKENRD